MFYCNRLKAVCLLGILGFTFLVSMVSIAAEETNTDTNSLKHTNQDNIPALSHVIPSAIRLDEQHTHLTEQLKEFSDLSLMKEKLAHLSESVNALSKQWLTLKTNKESSFDQISDLKLKLAEKTDSLNSVSETLIDKVEKEDRWKREWLKENDKWAKWDMVVKKDMALDPVKNLDPGRATGENQNQCGRCLWLGCPPCHAASYGMCGRTCTDTQKSGPPSPVHGIRG